MSLKDTFTSLFTQFSEAKTNAELWHHMVDFCKTFDLLHARVSIYDLHSQIDKIHFKHVITYPEGDGSWGEYYIRNRMYDYDRSFHLVFEQQTEALYWSKMDELTRTGTEANKVFVEMRKFGIGEGVLIAKSSQVMKHTLLFGLAGPARSFKAFKQEAEEAFLQSLHVFANRYLYTAIAEDILETPEGLPRIELSARSREVLRCLSLGKSSADTAALLGIKVDAVNKLITRLKGQTGIATREGLVAYALRTGQIH